MHQPRKRFGQNFLVDDSVVAAIIAALHPQRGDLIVEIGPGLGALTGPLLALVDELHAVEIDRDLAASLQRRYPRLALHNCDALKFDFARFGRKSRIVGNLPYNISTPLLFHLESCAASICDIHVMLQKEVVDRIAATPADSDYSRLSVMLQYRFAVEKLFDVGPEAFDPRPRVESAVVRLIPRHPLPWPARDEALFAQVVGATFAQRRKTLRNSLRAYLAPADFAMLGLDPQGRAQELGVAQFVAIADFVATRAG
ncbi:MAG TPA: 16S rRNA (adenine(1518)-N(6)/adenine(1519)-N(6))-dimethyltransferase RsmA [Burkholderiales bacterium]|nr:16S rRNA (adenine(1518)-N(6)/adenine(1519)-N(6))-dimethyltransferase RsmA [Burkholderiales bacterium]